MGSDRGPAPALLLRELRSMNISTEVLFPDLSGFARSLANRLAYVDVY